MSALDGWRGAVEREEALAPPDDPRTLNTTCPDGVVVTTRWLRMRAFGSLAQEHQADAHRAAVRDHLFIHGLRSLNGR